MSPSFVFHTLGHKRLLRNTYTVLFSGSTQAQVPVNPVCPYTASGAEGAQGLRFTMDTSGLSNPRPRRLMADFSVVNKRQVASLKKRLPLNSPPFSNI